MPVATPAPSATINRWRDKLLDTAVLAIPTALLTQSTAWIQGKFFAQPWQILWVALPLTAVAVVTWKLLRRPESRRISLSFAVFMAAFASVFAVASSSNLLVWKRVPLAEFEDVSSRNWLLPVRLGDWRYWVAPKLASASNLIVILLNHQAGASPARLRVRDAQLIQAAIAQHAKGVFFDVSYPGHSAADPIFCNAIRAASAIKLPIVTAFQVRQLRDGPDSGRFAPVPDEDGAKTPDCLLPNENGDRSRAHSMVFADVDGIVRTIPLKWKPADSLSTVPLSVRIAQRIDQELKLPDMKLLYFLPTSEPPKTYVGDREVNALLGKRSPLKDKYWLVGEFSDKDKFPTAFNATTPGTMIHAYAVEALLSKHYITRPPTWFSAFVVIAACCLLALLASQKAKPQTLILAAGGATGVVMALSAAAMALFMVWVDVIYAIVAVWLLVPMLIAYQRRASKAGTKTLDSTSGNEEVTAITD